MRKNFFVGKLCLFLVLALLICTFQGLDLNVSGYTETVVLDVGDVITKEYIPDSYNGNIILKTATLTFWLNITDTGKLVMDFPIPTGGSLNTAYIYLRSINNNVDGQSDELGQVGDFDDGGNRTVELDIKTVGLYEFEFQFMYQPSVISFSSIDITFKLQASESVPPAEEFKLTELTQFHRDDVACDATISLTFNKQLASVTPLCARIYKCADQGCKPDWTDPSQLVATSSEDVELYTYNRVNQEDRYTLDITPYDGFEPNTLYYMFLESGSVVSVEGDAYEGFDLRETVEGIEPYFYFRTGAPKDENVYLDLNSYTAVWDEELFSYNPNSEDYAESKAWKKLAFISAILSGKAYGTENTVNHPLIDDFESIGLIDNVYHNNESKFLRPGYAFGHKTITRNGKETELVLAVFRGTENDSGISDILTDAAESIGGIGDAAFGAAYALNNYLNENGIDKSNSVFLVCGHSLGGGMAAVVARDLSLKYGIAKEDIFGFTFASPKTDTDNTKGFTNISNFVSKNCGVSFLGALGSKHIGEVYYVSTPKGAPFTRGHNIDSYTLGVSNYTGKEKPDWLRRLFIRCPVDVFIYDNLGNLLCSVVNDKIIGTPTIPVYVEDGHKYFLLERDTEYNIDIRATDVGTMDVIVSDLNTENGIATEEQWLDLSLVNGFEFVCNTYGTDDPMDSELYNESKAIRSFEDRLGDVNDDGNVNSADAAYVLQYDVKLVTTLPYLKGADTDGDGKINAMDASLILQYDVKLISKFPRI